MQEALKWVENNQTQILENMKELLRIPSISTDSENKKDIYTAANWLVANFNRIGLEAKLLERDGAYPVVFAQTKIDPSKPTILCYFHYDVQPAGEDSLWKYPAFQPTIENDRIYGRGTNDNKLTGMMSVVAMESMFATNSNLPVNLKFCLEGEEELGSPNVVDIVKDNLELFSCDYIIHSDGTHLAEDLPSIEVGTRGVVYTQIRLSIGTKDMHSGEFGGYVKNANFELAKVLASLKDEKGRVAIPGFYDGIIEPTAEELDSWSKVPITQEDRIKTSGVYALDNGEEGYSLIERNWARPCLDINGMWGGYISEGSKTIIPFEARAKVSMRIVPGQTENDILNKFISYLKTFENDGVKIELEWEHSGASFLTSPDDPIFNKTKEAYKEVFNTEAFLIRTGGTIGLLKGLQSLFNVPILSINGRSPDEDIHAPNEFMRLKNFWRGIEVFLRLWDKMK